MMSVSAAVSAALPAVEELLLDTARRKSGASLAPAVEHLLAAGGKRIRPRLTVACALAGSTTQARPAVLERAVPAAAAIELLHLSTLVHDDIIDDAGLRRGVPTVNALWGDATAVLVGDVLLANAVDLAGTAWPQAAQTLGRAYRRICEGQASETEQRFDVCRSAADYFDAIDGKTAALIGLCCELGGGASQLPVHSIANLRKIGHHLGRAFQLLDDALDVVGSEAALGKPAGHDIIEGVYTYPLILALDAESQLAELLAAPLTDGRRLEALKIVAGSGAVKATVARAGEEADLARRELRGLSASDSFAPEAIDLLPSLTLSPLLNSLGPMVD